MQDQPGDIEILISEATEYIEAKTELWKLKAVDSVSDFSAEVISKFFMIIVWLLFLLVFSAGLALLIGYWLGYNFWGFFIVAAVYAVMGLICFLLRHRLFKRPVSNLIIEKFLK